VLERRTPYLLFTDLILSISVFGLTSSKWEEWEEVRIRTTLECMFKNLKGDLMKIMGVKLTPGKLITL
jgi:hypothetical protein